MSINKILILGVQVDKDFNVNFINAKAIEELELKELLHITLVLQIKNYIWLKLRGIIHSILKIIARLKHEIHFITSKLKKLRLLYQIY